MIPTFDPERARPLWERWARHQYQYGGLEEALNLERRIAEVYPSGMKIIQRPFLCINIDSDSPIKLFAQRHMYLGLDAIAARDLGFAMACKVANRDELGRLETQQSIASATPSAINTHKRRSSPEFRKRDERGGGNVGGGEYSQGHKRARPLLPPVRKRDQWVPPPRLRFSPPPAPAWDRKSRERPPLPPIRVHVQAREEEKPRPSVVFENLRGTYQTPGWY